VQKSGENFDEWINCSYKEKEPALHFKSSNEKRNAEFELFKAGFQQT